MPMARLSSIGSLELFPFTALAERKPKMALNLSLHEPSQS